MPKRCYILGAGFSKPIGLPLARELTQAVFQHVDSGATGALAEPLGRALSQWASFMKKLYPRCDFSSASCGFEDAWPDFEDLITVLDEWEDYRHDVQGTPTPPGSNQPARIRRVLLKHLALLFCEKTPAKGDEKLEPVLQFVQRCNENKSPVISFNWDVLLEAAARDENAGYSYREEDDKNGVLLMVKPHGSINIADTANDPNKDPHSQCKQLLEYDEYDNKIGKRYVICANDPRRSNKDIVDPYGVENNRSHEDSDQADQEPSFQTVQDLGRVLLVAPTAKKSYENQWLIKQWSRAHKFIRSAEEIVVIGFSLPPTDYRPRVLLQLAGLESRTKARRLILVSPHACEVAKHYRKFVSLPIECRNSDWREWMEEES